MGKRIAVIGAGPAGLMAAEHAALAGLAVDVYDAMPSPGRKLLMAGRGGLNLTHSEPLPAFLQRYGARRGPMARMLADFGPAQQVGWVEALGVPVFTGSSGRVFPRAMKAAPLLRAWLRRLGGQGVVLHRRHRWTGWSDDGHPRFDTPDGPLEVRCDALVLAAGGGSWARLGSDGRWAVLLAERGVAIRTLRPANCGFECAWSEHLRGRFAGTPLKPVALTLDTPAGPVRETGECMLTVHGIEGGAVYALSGALRDAIERDGEALLHLDLAPDRDAAALAGSLGTSRGGRSLSEWLRRRAGITGVKAALLRECLPPTALADMSRLAAGIKSLPLRVLAPRPIDEAISTAGGVPFEGLDAALMVRALPGVFCAGEMLDWEAPTGGYLLTACLATGRVAGRGAARWVAGDGGRPPAAPVQPPFDAT